MSGVQKAHYHSVAFILGNLLVYVDNIIKSTNIAEIDKPTRIKEIIEKERDNYANRAAWE